MINEKEEKLLQIYDLIFLGNYKSARNNCVSLRRKSRAYRLKYNEKGGLKLAKIMQVVILC